VFTTGGRRRGILVIDPTGKLPFPGRNQDSDTITILEYRQKTGAVTPANRTLDVPSPCRHLIVQPSSIYAVGDFCGLCSSCVIIWEKPMKLYEKALSSTCTDKKFLPWWRELG